MLETIILVVIGCGIIAAAFSYAHQRIQKKIERVYDDLVKYSQLSSNQSITVNTDLTALEQTLEKINEKIEDMPDQVLQTVTGSSNTHKGKLGELIGFLTIKAQYDRIIPMGSIVDFIGIKLPEGNNPGHIDFIDIKTGDNARLSKDQRGLKTIIAKKQINFKTVKIDTIEGYKDDDGSSTD